MRSDDNNTVWCPNLQSSLTFTHSNIHFLSLWMHFCVMFNKKVRTAGGSVIHVVIMGVENTVANVLWLCLLDLFFVSSNFLTQLYLDRV